MVVDSQFHNLRDLSLALQELLRSRFPQIAPIQVFCLQMSHKLLVLVQHSSRAMPDEHAVGQILQTTLEQDPPPSIQQWLAQTERAQMELFLRVTGDNQVYASGMFDLAYGGRSRGFPLSELSPQALFPLIPSPSAPESLTLVDSVSADPEDLDGDDSLGDSFELAAEDLDESVIDAFSLTPSLEAIAPSDAADVPEPAVSPPDAVSSPDLIPEESSLAPLVHGDAEDGAIVPREPEPLAPSAERSPASESALVPTTAPPSADPPAEVKPSAPAKPWVQEHRRQRQIALGIAGIVAIASGIYALSRPCVLGECQNIIQAQALDATASATIQDPQSAQEVVDAYDQWVDASYLLQQIPPWSRSYTEAQRLLGIYEERMGVLNNVVQAQHQAYAAAVKSQNPPHPVDVWREIRILWQEAITLLQAVPQESSVYPLAQQKLLEYEANLGAIDGRIETERAAQAKIQTAREAATVAEARQQVANSLATWQQAYATWQATINLLRQVPTNTMSYAESQQLLEIYQTKLGAARDRLQQETIAQSSYQQALALADQAAAYEDSRQWSQAVISWRDALNQAQQVPKGTTYHDQAQPLIMSYSQSLSTAEEKLQAAVSLQEAEVQVAQLCNTSKQCTSRMSGDRIQIQVTQSALGNGTFPLPGTTQPIAEPFNNLLRSVADIGQRAQVKIDVFNVDGSLFGTYTPDVNGYVPASTATTPEPYRF